jgi:hypothetical protein
MSKEQRQLSLPLTRQTVHVHIKNPPEHLVYEGEVKMSQQQQEAYKALVGDGLARVTVSKELSESDYGSGGKTMVSISLTCDQSHAVVNQAITFADQLALYWVDQHQQQLRQILVGKGLVK